MSGLADTFADDCCLLILCLSVYLFGVVPVYNISRKDVVISIKFPLICHVNSVGENKAGAMGAFLSLTLLLFLLGSLKATFGICTNMLLIDSVGSRSGSGALGSRRVHGFL